MKLKLNGLTAKSRSEERDAKRVNVLRAMRVAAIDSLSIKYPFPFPPLRSTPLPVKVTQAKPQRT